MEAVQGALRASRLAQAIKSLSALLGQPQQAGAQALAAALL